MDCGWFHRAVRGFLLCGAGRSVSQGGRALCLSQPRARSAVGISFWLGEFVSGGSGGDGDVGGGTSAVFVIPCPGCGRAAVSRTSWELRVYIHCGAAACSAGGAGSDGGELLERAVGRRDPGAVDLLED